MISYWQVFLLIGGSGYLAYELARRKYDVQQEEVIERTISYLITKGYMKGYMDEHGVEHMLKLNESAPDQK